jgi:hypothetical protein
VIDAFKLKHGAAVSGKRPALILRPDAKTVVGFRVWPSLLFAGLPLRCTVGKVNGVLGDFRISVGGAVLRKMPLLANDLNDCQRVN